MKYFKKIIGEFCYLSPINPDDASQYAEWLNDLEITKFLAISHHQLNIMRERAILEEMIKNNSQIFGIVDKKTDKLIGNCSLFDVNHRSRKAELGIFIGAKDYWNKGYGTEAVKLILDYGFNILNLQNIIIKVYEFNKRAIAVYQKAGFRIIGSRRESKIFSGKKYDEIYMDILATEFESVYVQKVMNRE